MRSGGVPPETASTIAETGVDLISVGPITHSAATLDLGLDIEVVESGDGRSATAPDLLPIAP